MKYIKNLSDFIVEKKSDLIQRIEELILLFNDVLNSINDNLTIEDCKKIFNKYNLSILKGKKGKSPIVTPFPGVQYGNIFFFIYNFLDELINELNKPDNNLLLSGLLEQNKVKLRENYYKTIGDGGKKIEIREYEDDTSADYIKILIKLLTKNIGTNKIGDLVKDYKKILTKSGLCSEPRDGKYYDPMNYVDQVSSSIENDDDDLKHDPIGSNEDVIPILLKYYKPGHKFLDIGAGHGNILRLAKKIGYDPSGIEIRDTKQYTKSLNVIYDDFFNVDGKIISKFDIIYFYRPFQWDVEMNKFLEKLQNDAKTGSIIIYVYPHINNKEKLETTFPNFKFVEKYEASHSILVFEKI